MPIVLAALGAGAAALLIPGEMEAVHQQLLGFPDADRATHQARPWILASLCFLPALGSLLYALGDTLDRYIARDFAGTFLLCMAALGSVWFLMDLSDKLGDFRESGQILRTMGAFYATRAPSVLMLLLPYSLLLALLYSLGKLSAQHEIIGMVQSGRSIVRITLPLAVAGAVFSIFGIGLNYQWAPTAEGRVEKLLAEAQGKLPAVATNVLYLNSDDSRLWEIAAFPRDYEKGQPLLHVEITTTRPNKTLKSRLVAKQASWDPASQQWTFLDAVEETYRDDEPPVFHTHSEPLVVSGWSETPWQLVKPGMSAAELGVPDLTGWIDENARRGGFADPAPYLTQWHHRWALPFTCMVTVLLATPLAIHFSRRGAGGGVFMAVVLSALMLVSTNISLAMGESGTLRPAVAAWLPNLFFALLGLYLFRRRITGKPIYLVLRRLLPSSD